MERLSTGIGGIDRHLSGGFAPGSVVAIVAEPQMQSEAVIHEMIKHRPTLYLTTVREAYIIRDHLETISQEQLSVKSVRDAEKINNEFVEELTGSMGHSLEMDQNKIVDNTYEMIQNVDQQANVILDPTNPLEETDEKSLYRELLNELKSTIHETDSLGVLHCLTSGESPAFRDLTLTIADIVIHLELVSLTDSLEYQVTIPKNRIDGPMLKNLSIKIDDRVWIDESRNI